MWEKIQDFITEIGKKNYKTRKLALWLTERHMHSEYKKLCESIPTEEKTILFTSFNGKKYACSPRAIYEYMGRDKRFQDFKFIWAFRDSKIAKLEKKFEKRRRTTLVEFKSDEYYESFARAKYIVVNSTLPSYIIKKEDQVIIQTWHGTPLKHIGLDSTIESNPLASQHESHKIYLNDARKYDYLVSPSAFCTRVFATAFGLDKLGKKDILIETGYPRNDFLLKYSQRRVDIAKQSLHIPPDKKVILYAPTWRDNQHTFGVGNTLDIESTFSEFMKNISDDYVVLLRLHYIVASRIDVSAYPGKVFNFSRLDDVNILYIISDILITDYSSVFFDYANLHRPILFYMYDLDEYRTQIRDFYIDLEELPGPILKTQRELLDAVYRIDEIEEEYRERYQTFCDTYNYLDDGNAAKRVVDICIK